MKEPLPKTSCNFGLAMDEMPQMGEKLMRDFSKIKFLIIWFPPNKKYFLQQSSL
jgi:hypothetical protein